ncbi:tRNA (guanosine(18)-2'-O)-methyltransferase TrmH [Halieaceae bacterium IMCC14734]|uniref:tRNA (guanosine(18)-2'-O)-methyltransferase n=1 Tax=Candidatus Litorirhabdus singularis TaxID=2518993 RepID=A0ABT3TJ43_9GAMM|nr:tRNA (guanosine(18)-2'-O)-methyltransferase TrmH [Candidatus Litorirhabdus singularis]MCX2982347.1 tRNA (guanosine(18)-2'-O)-methyltransferase TrmH [Candidatus Litorirhabdus singularis]
MTPERIGRLRAVLDRRQPDLTVITDFVNKQRNVSALVRNCDAVGIMTAHTVVEKDNYKAFRGTAMGSHHWVEVVCHETLDAALDIAREQDMQVIAAHLGTDSIDYREPDYTRPTALLMGAEKRGVSAHGVASADCCITIPMVGMVASFNVSVAAGIILAEVQRQREAAGLYRHRRIDDATYRRLFFEWGHPSVREFCIERDLEYPELDASGEIDSPSLWYEGVRQQLAKRDLS